MHSLVLEFKNINLICNIMKVNNHCLPHRAGSGKILRNNLEKLPPIDGNPEDRPKSATSVNDNIAMFMQNKQKIENYVLSPPNFKKGYNALPPKIPNYHFKLNHANKPHDITSSTQNLLLPISTIPSEDVKQFQTQKKHFTPNHSPVNSILIKEPASNQDHNYNNMQNLINDHTCGNLRIKDDMIRKLIMQLNHQKNYMNCVFNENLKKDLVQLNSIQNHIENRKHIERLNYDNLEKRKKEVQNLHYKIIEMQINTKRMKREENKILKMNSLKHLHSRVQREENYALGMQMRNEKIKKFYHDSLKSQIVNDLKQKLKENELSNMTKIQKLLLLNDLDGDKAVYKCNNTEENL